MTPEVLAATLAEFTWPAPYTLEDARPDGIFVHFPKCDLLFVEGFESDMEVQFAFIRPVDPSSPLSGSAL